MEWNVGLNGFNDIDPEMLRLIIIVSIPLVIVSLILMIAALVNLFKKQITGSDKIIWALIIIFIDLIGPILYFAVGSNYLDQKIAKREEEQENRQQ